MEKKEEIFGLPIDEYISPEEKERQEEAKALDICSAVEKIQEEQSSVSRGIHNLLEKIANRLALSNATAQTAHKIDIEALNLVKDIATLEKLQNIRLANERSILRLEIGEAQQIAEAQLAASEATAAELAGWISRTREDLRRMEKNVVDRKTLYEIRSGKRITERYKEAAKKIDQIGTLAKSISALLSENASIFSKEEEEENGFADSFVRLGTQEDRSILHLLSLLPNAENQKSNNSDRDVE